MPCPRFLTEAGEAAPSTIRRLSTLLQTKDYYSLEGGLLEIADADGCSSTVQQIIIELVQAIERMEAQRGQISRTARSELSEGGQVCQKILDKVLLSLVGLGADKEPYIAERLSVML